MDVQTTIKIKVVNLVGDELYTLWFWGYLESSGSNVGFIDPFGNMGTGPVALRQTLSRTLSHTSTFIYNTLFEGFGLPPIHVLVIVMARHKLKLSFILGVVYGVVRRVLGKWWITTCHEMSGLSILKHNNHWVIGWFLI